MSNLQRNDHKLDKAIFFKKLQSIPLAVITRIGTVGAVGILGASIIFIALPQLSKTYCSSNPTKCVGIEQPEFRLPDNVFASLVGSIMGASASFIGFYLLEKIKKTQLPKPDISVSFLSIDQSITDSEDIEYELGQFINTPFEDYCVYLPEEGEGYNIGRPYWVRVKVTNNGNLVAKQCRAYLVKISRFEGVFSDNPNKVKWNKINKLSNSLPLFWAYERLADYFIIGSGVNFPSKSSYFADVFVLHNPTLNLNNITNGSKNWFIKLKTKPNPEHHWNMCEIDKSKDVSYKFDIEVYADECSTSRVSIVLQHRKSQDEVCFYCLDESGVVQNEKQIIIKLPPPNKIIKVPTGDHLEESPQEELDLKESKKKEILINF
jgi:hypothetical protein